MLSSFAHVISVTYCCLRHLPFFFYASAPHRDLHSFPTRRSSDLRCSCCHASSDSYPRAGWWHGSSDWMCPFCGPVRGCEDRKSTRLNSSHRTISYAVFCLKKKKKNDIQIMT